MHTLRTMLVAAGVALLACTARADAKAEQKSEGFGSLTVDQVSDLIAKHEADIFDNNGKDDWQKGHVPSAKWVKFNAVTADDLPKDHQRKLVFYCANTH